MEDRKIRRSLIFASIASFCAAVFAVVGQLYYYNGGKGLPLDPHVNIIVQEFNQYMMLQNFVNLERIFLILGVATVLLTFSFPTLRTRRRLTAFILTTISAVYFNLLFLWTSTVFNSFWIQYSETIISLLIKEGSLFNVLNFLSPLPSWDILAVGPFIVADYLSVALLILTFLSVLYALRFARAVQVLSLLIIPLPIEIFFFDRLEFNLYVIGAFSSNAMLEHFTNSTLLEICVSSLVVSTLWIHSRKDGLTDSVLHRIRKVLI